MYKVIKFFTDLQDNSYAYREGETFPREGVKVSDARLKELSTTANRRGIPLIEKVEDEPKAEEVIEPAEDFMNPPEEKPAEKPRKKRGRPRNDAE